MTKLEKIKEIKHELHRTFKKLDRIVNTTEFGEELQIFLKINNIKGYLERKIKEIEAGFARI